MFTMCRHLWMSGECVGSPGTGGQTVRGTHPLFPAEQPVLLTPETSLQTQDCGFYSSLSTIRVHRNVWNIDWQSLDSITKDGLHNRGCICLASVRPWVQYLLITKTFYLLCQTTTAVEKDQEQIRGKAKTRVHVGWNRLLDQSRAGQWVSICHSWEIHYNQSHEISLAHLSVSNTKLPARRFWERKMPKLVLVHECNPCTQKTKPGLLGVWG